MKIEQYLLLSSALSLSYTCRRFRQTIKAKVEDLSYIVDMECILGYPLESEEDSALSFQRLSFLCLLEKDGRLSASKYTCSGCETTHDFSRFSSKELEKGSHQRRCMNHSRIQWTPIPENSRSLTSRPRVSQRYRATSPSLGIRLQIAATQPTSRR